MNSIAREKTIQINASGLTLEGAFWPGEGTHAAVITHPHPLYGGDMNNPVVIAISQAYASKGWGTLRFNFRGAGNSQGQFDHGNGETKDVHGAIGHLKAFGFQSIELAGYSFGSWVLARWANRNRAHDYRLRFVAPPVAFLDYGDIEQIQGLVQVIVGGRDEIAPADAVASQLKNWAPMSDFHIIENADHFFWHHMDQIIDRIWDRIEAPG